MDFQTRHICPKFTLNKANYRHGNVLEAKVLRGCFFLPLFYYFIIIYGSFEY